MPRLVSARAVKALQKALFVAPDAVATVRRTVTDLMATAMVPALSLIHI